ncbi:MAG: molybdate transport system substrate-binding protein [Pseudohongiellaceae bacterium]|jgi:molybdate transport system substrate-binding protein
MAVIRTSLLIKLFIQVFIQLCLFSLGYRATAEEATIAVASNFIQPMTALVEEFEANSTHKLRVVYGSSGRLFAQISNGAPFDIFLSADSVKPAALIEDGYGVPGSQMTYAIGRLALWSNKAVVKVDSEEALLNNEFSAIAIANPRLAPYGLAAKQSLESMGFWERLKSKLVQGENISQTYQFVFTGNADIGFVSYSQLGNGNNGEMTNYWLVPSEYHDAITQDSVLLARAAENKASLDFIDYLKSDSASKLIESFGYQHPVTSIAGQLDAVGHK